MVDGLLTEGNVGASSNALDSGTNVSFCEAPDGPASLMIKDIILDSLYQVAVQMSGIGLLENARSSSLGCQCGYPQVHNLNYNDKDKDKLAYKTVPSVPNKILLNDK